MDTAVNKLCHAKKAITEADAILANAVECSNKYKAAKKRKLKFTKLKVKLEKQLSASA